RGSERLPGAAATGYLPPAVARAAPECAPHGSQVARVSARRRGGLCTVAVCRAPLRAARGGGSIPFCAPRQLQEASRGRRVGFCRNGWRAAAGRACWVVE